jgi:hypothetical protein
VGGTGFRRVVQGQGSLCCCKAEAAQVMFASSSVVLHASNNLRVLAFSEHCNPAAAAASLIWCGRRDGRHSSGTCAMQSAALACAAHAVHMLCTCFLRSCVACVYTLYWSCIRLPLLCSNPTVKWWQGCL